MSKLFDDPILAEVRLEFLKEVESEGLYWLTFRKDTLVDLIVKDLLLQQNSFDRNRLIRVFNSIVKIKILQLLPKINLDSSLTELFQKLYNYKDAVLGFHNDLLVSFKPEFEENHKKLYDNFVYLKVASNLDLSQYNEAVFDELLDGIYFQLRQEEY